MLLSLTCLSNSYADSAELNFSAGSDFFGSYGKHFQVGIIKPVQRLNSVLLFSGVLGILNDDNVFGNAYSFYFEADIKLRVKTKSGLYISASQGIAFLTDVPKNLSSNWQLPTGLALGLYNNHNNYMGLTFKHFSNGSTHPDNLGKEYVGIEFGWEL